MSEHEHRQERRNVDINQEGGPAGGRPAPTSATENSRGMTLLNRMDEFRRSTALSRSDSSAAPAALAHPRPVASPGDDMEVEEYLSYIDRIERFYQERSQGAAGATDSTRAVAGLRALYGYEGGAWEHMIPDAPQVSAPTARDVPGLERLFMHDARGNRLRARHVRLPNGDLIDPGHVFTGIDASLHPRTQGGLAAMGVGNLDAATWAGDVGQAVVQFREARGGLTHQHAWNDAASVPDLNADLDGVVLGATYDRSRSLTSQLRAYYQGGDLPTGNAPYERRYSAFCNTRGLTRTNTHLDGNAHRDIAASTNHFATAYAARNASRPAQVAAGIGHMFEGSRPTNDRDSQEMTGRFVSYVNAGLDREARGAGSR